jgi:hypothetical protein
VDNYPEQYLGRRGLFHDEITLQKISKPGIVLELHNNILSDNSFNYSAPVEWFWTQTEPMDTCSQVGFENLLMLSPTAQILYASAHNILKHGGNVPLRWVYDLDRIIHIYSKRIDWDLLFSQARIFEWGSAVGMALSQTYAYFNTPIPNRVLEELPKLQDRHTQWIVRKQTPPPTRLLDELQNMMVMNWLGRFVMILSLVYPSPAYMRWRYGIKNPWAVPVYYLLRWWIILKDTFYTIAHLVGKRLQKKP